ncbi:MAG: transporter [Epulopiscium sp. Nuni2H_MBin003]|nr:MAG: transporter [Epulopiscium sp. Nuni2H_MBin003]
MENKSRVKLGIYLCSLLMMGAIAVASNIANIMAAFPDVAPTTIVAYLISVPCLIVIPVTLITGKLMDSIAKKTLMIIGILFWLIGGVVPYFLTSLTSILVMRCIFGVGVGMVQTLCAALVVENFDDATERNQTMGNVAAFQMLGTVIFSLVAGNLGKLGWNVAFLVHLIAVVSLIGAIIFLPHKQPIKSTATATKFQPTSLMWTWAIIYMIFMVGGQTYANSAAALIEEMNLGDSVAAGYSLAIFAVGGLVMGLVYGKFAKKFGKATLSLGCCIMIVAFLLIALVPNLLVSYFGAFLCGVSLSICIPGAINGTAASVTPESSGMAVSVATCTQNIGMALCPYIVTPAGAMLVSATNPNYTVNQGALLCATGIVAVVAIMFMGVSKK